VIRGFGHRLVATAVDQQDMGSAIAGAGVGAIAAAEVGVIAAAGVGTWAWALRTISEALPASTALSGSVVAVAPAAAGRVGMAARIAVPAAMALIPLSGVAAVAVITFP